LHKLGIPRQAYTSMDSRISLQKEPVLFTMVFTFTRN